MKNLTKDTGKAIHRVWSTIMKEHMMKYFVAGGVGLEINKINEKFYKRYRWSKDSAKLILNSKDD